jgi:hypothetical protein
MARTIDLMERQFRRTVDWKTKIMANPVPYALGAAGVLFLLVGGPRRTIGFIQSRRPRPKTRFEKLLEQLPEPIAERVAPGVKRAVDTLADLPDDLRKAAQAAQRERDKQLQKEEEERLKRVARATMLERVLLKLAEAAGAALAGYLMKTIGDRMLGGREEKSA